MFTDALAALVPLETVTEGLGRDESGAGTFLPDFVVSPSTTQQVSKILRLCSEHRVPVTVRGAGSGKSGGCLPVNGGVLMLTRRLNQIVEVRPADNLLVAQPGVVLAEVHRAAESTGRFYPPDPASADYCSLGGTIAENAAGPRAFKYGVTRDYLMGVEAVLANGDIIRTGRKAGKSVAGYDLTALLCGSEGTLAVITEATLEIIPQPRLTFTALLSFVSVRAASEAVTRIISSGLHPVTLELLDTLAMRAAGLQGDAAIILEVDGNHEDALLADLERAATAAEALDCQVATSSSERGRLWAARKSVSQNLRALYPHKLSEDIAVPRSRIPDMIDAVRAIADREKLAFATYGHAGDGNLHTNFLWTDDSQLPAVDRALAETFRAAVGLEGTITGEHGVGLLKKNFLALEQSPQLLSLQRRLKNTFDPLGILNPGKLLPDER